MKVLIGVDPHKASVAVAAVEEVGELIECATFPQNRTGLRALERFKRNGSPNVVGRWRTLAVSVGIWQGGCARLRSVWWTCHPSFRHGCVCSRASLATPVRTTASMPWPPRLRPRATKGWQRSIPMPTRRYCAFFSERRGDLVAERTRACNRLHGLLRDLLPGGVPGTLSARRAAHILRGIRPQGSSSGVHRRLASEILRDIRTLDRKIANLNEGIEAEVEASGSTLTEIFGIGPILAAKIMGTVGTVVRFPTKAHFASYSGTAPVEASSGEMVRHRLSSLAGNRHLNTALHMVAVCQAR
jgi:transposase